MILNPLFSASGLPETCSELHLRPGVHIGHRLRGTRVQAGIQAHGSQVRHGSLLLFTGTHVTVNLYCLA